jgi:hypothetical protein
VGKRPARRCRFTDFIALNEANGLALLLMASFLVLFFACVAVRRWLLVSQLGNVGGTPAPSHGCASIAGAG